METIAVSELRASLMHVLRRIESGESLIITSRGRQIARLVPPESPANKARQALKKLRETAIIKEVLSPLEPVADLVPHSKRGRLEPHPVMSQIRLHYDPVEPLAEDEWPETSR